jgi:glycosyltransferase involved in cell wall biosynthesis
LPEKRSTRLQLARQWIGNNVPFAKRAHKSARTIFWKLDAWFSRFSGKPRVLILVDKPGWAYDASARQIKRHLAAEFNIRIRYSGDQTLSPNDCDLLHVCFWADSSYQQFGFDRERVIKEVSSHCWQHHPLPKYMFHWGPFTSEEFAQRYLSDCDTVICPSRRLTATVGRVFARTFYTPNGADLSRFTAVGRTPGANLIYGWAGDIDWPIKGFRDIIEPACGERFELVAAKGELDSRKMPEFYRKVDVFVIASQHEGEPLTLPEAMASGCFPVCVDVGIVPELITHKENGYIVGDRSVDAFREAFEWCDRNRDRVRAAGLANAELIARERNWATCAQNFGQVYKETLARVKNFNPRHLSALSRETSGSELFSNSGNFSSEQQL